MAKYTDIVKGTTASLMTRAKRSVDWIKTVLKAMMGQMVNPPPPPPPPPGTPVPPTPATGRGKFAVPVISVELGDMYMFGYHDPKHKATLPFFDRYPLVVVINTNIKYKNGEIGFMGLNLHYLKPAQRAILMDALDAIKSNDKYDETTKIKATYELLKSTGNFPGFERCVKVYLYRLVTGATAYYVNPADWEFVVTLPLAQWETNPNPKYAGSPPY